MTSPTPTIQLNKDQQDAADAFFQFLFSNETEMNISGPGGVGKTTLMGHLIDRIMPMYFEQCELLGVKPEYDSVVMTATTNKAADVLARSTGQDVQTVQSYLRLKVKDDYKTGASKLSKRNDFIVHDRIILFVDECSMIDSQLYHFIHEGTSGSKIVYIGDHCQLAPVMETISPVYRNKLGTSELLTPVRNAGQQALMDVCTQLRQSVETLDFYPIKEVPGVIDIADDDMLEAELSTHFSQQTRNDRILAYTNNRVIQYNDYIRDLRQLPKHPVVGENLINNTAIRMAQTMISVEQPVKISKISAGTNFDKLPDVHEEVLLEYYEADLETSGVPILDVKLPADRDHYTALLKHYGRKKNWECYFYLKNSFPDLRPRDACTVHKAQGSTYDTVFIDLENISTCHNPSQAARMLYVAFTRAKNRIILYGDLAEKYGGVIS